MTLLDVLLDDVGLDVEDVMDEELAEALDETICEAHEIDPENIDPPD